MSERLQVILKQASIDMDQPPPNQILKHEILTINRYPCNKYMTRKSLKDILLPECLTQQEQLKLRNKISAQENPNFYFMYQTTSSITLTRHTQPSNTYIDRIGIVVVYNVQAFVSGWRTPSVSRVLDGLHPLIIHKGVLLPIGPKLG